MNSPLNGHEKSVALQVAALAFLALGILSIALFAFSSRAGVGNLLRGLGYLAFSPYTYALSGRKNLGDPLAYMDLAWPWKLAGLAGICFLVADLVVQLFGS